MRTLEGKSIIVTGGASGIGAAACLRAAALGALVTVADRNSDRGAALVEQIRSDGGTARSAVVDTSRESDVQALVEGVLTAYGRLDGAFNNAGVASHSHLPGHRSTPLAEMTLEEFRRTQEINVNGTFLCLKHEIPAMLRNGGGSIVNTSSDAGILAVADAADYVTSKHGVIGLTKSAALDYATQGIRANALLPGVTRTAMVETSFGDKPELWDWAARMQPIGRIAEPAEIAEGAIWLLSDAASFVTGISLPVDGGFSMV